MTLRGVIFHHQLSEMLSVAVSGYLMISCIFIYVYIFDKTHYLLEVSFLLVGAILNIICSLISLFNIREYNYFDVHTTTLAFTTACCGAVMVVDLTRQMATRSQWASITMDVPNKQTEIVLIRTFTKEF